MVQKNDPLLEREEMVSWLKQHETKFFLDKLDKVAIANLAELSSINETGDALTKKFYFIQGVYSGLIAAKELASDLAEGSIS